MTELTLEQRLVALGTGVTFPGEDSLADDVLASISPARPRRWRRRALVAAAALLLVVAAVTAVPGSRRAVARWLGFDSLRIAVVDELPPPISVAAVAGLTLDEAAAQIGITPVVAPILGDPVAVEAPGGRSILLRYDEAIVETLPGTLDDGQFGKLATTGAEVTTVDVDGATAYWISGAPHAFVYADGEGVVREVRTARDALVWSRGDVLVRIEGDITLGRAVEIAEAVREP